MEKAIGGVLASVSDDELLAEALDRGLVLGVSTKDLVELAWGVKNNKPELVKSVVVRLAREHLGKVL